MSILVLFLIFVIYSILGFIVETIYTSLPAKRLMHRGFLFGPYIPIYGFGSALITFFIQPYQGNWLVVFILSFLICSVLEYITSYLLEVAFHARWWDYSMRKMNINGRICMRNSCLFGIGGIIIVEGINTKVMDPQVLGNIQLIQYLGMVLFVVISIDFLLSIKVMRDIKQLIDLSTGDNTETIKEQKVEYVKDRLEEISEEMKNQIARQSVFHRRILKAFDIRIYKK